MRNLHITNYNKRYFTIDDEEGNELVIASHHGKAADNPEWAVSFPMQGTFDGSIDHSLLTGITDMIEKEICRRETIQ